MSTMTTHISQQSIDTIRTLSMDAVQAANSGHPGTPMALAPVAYVLWTEFLKYDPTRPDWPARDRFVLSCGHASMLLYSLLHLSGTKQVDAAGNVGAGESITLDDIKNFRQLRSPCAGHPEFGDAAGIETTTGPLGQGIGNSVGMAAAAKWLAAKYNRRSSEVFGNDVYALCSDGDLMEGVGSEAASLAGHLQLDNLCWIYDDNRITIEGKTDLAFSEDVATRFRGYGWHVVEVEDANDLDAIRNALKGFQQTTDRPTLVILKSVIAWGSPNKADTAGAHGSPLGEEEIRLTKQAYDWPADQHFLVPAEVKEHFHSAMTNRCRSQRENWERTYAAYAEAHPQEGSQVAAILAGRLPANWDADLPSFAADEKLATRACSGKVLNVLAERIPWLIGGSADLAPSNNTLLSGEEDFSAGSFAGRNIHFGIREHGMASMANGMSLVGLRPYVGTFFVFSDYLRPAMRLSALMHQPVLYIFTHDSIGLGEDGPTHQPVEHLAACRAIPGLTVIRPADGNEVVAAYRAALSLDDRPTALVLTRQKLPTLCRQRFASADGAARGGYVLADSGTGDPDLILIGTGSEVSLCAEAYDQLSSAGANVRLVSLPSWEIFAAQDEAYRESVLPAAVTKRIAVEAGVLLGWERFIGTQGKFIGMSSFGASAPCADLYEHFGITVERIMATAKQLLA